jgi:hypothetical protein
MRGVEPFGRNGKHEVVAAPVRDEERDLAGRDPGQRIMAAHAFEDTAPQADVGPPRAG